MMNLRMRMILGECGEGLFYVNLIGCDFSGNQKWQGQKKQEVEEND